MRNLHKCFICVMPFFTTLHAQRIDVSNFNYREFLDFGQNKGVFGLDSSVDSNAGSGVNPPIVSGKKSDFTFPISAMPNFSAASNYGNLTHIGRGFVATANHITSSLDSSQGILRSWGRTQYILSNNGSDVSSALGADNKFARLNKYIIEGEARLLETSFTNTLTGNQTAQESQNLAEFQKAIENLAKDSNGNIYTFMTGSGAVELTNGIFTTALSGNRDSGEKRGGSLGTLHSSNYITTQYCDTCTTSGIYFGYNPGSAFRNASTSGDSGSGVYAYDTSKKQWILLGVHSKGWGNNGYSAFVSNNDFKGFQSGFEQNISLTSTKYTMNNQGLESPHYVGFQGNKDIIFSSTQNSVEIEVGANIYRNVSGQAGGFVFSDSESSVTYKFTNQSGQHYLFNGSGLDIGKNIVVEWALRNQSGDSLHKIGQGTLKITTNYTPTSANENLGYLKIGEGKVILDTATKAYEGIYITSGRGSIELVQGKAESIGAVKVSNADSGALGANGIVSITNSYTFAQSSANNGGMGIYFGSNGGGLDLKGNSLTFNTIAANDSGAVITNTDSAKSLLTLEGFGYDSNGTKTQNKADTIIHANIGNVAYDENGNLTLDSATNIALSYTGDRASNDTNNADSNASTNNVNSVANLIFDGNINISGDLNAKNAHITLQGHAKTHTTISDSKDIETIKQAHIDAGNPLPDYIDLRKPSNLNQPDWDTRTFNLNEIKLTNSTLNVGRNALVSADISADSSSKITLGSGVKHFVDEKDGANINASGFGYYQKVVSGNLDGVNKQAADLSSAYRGTISASGANIESTIAHFNANLDLSNSAKLNATYLTLDSNNTIKLDNATAEIENLHLHNLNNLNGKITLSNSANFSVDKGFIVEDSHFDLDGLDSTNITKSANFSVVGVGNSSISGANSDISGDVALYDKSSLNVKNISFKDNNSASVYADKSANLTLSGALSAENANVIVALGGEKKFNIEAKQGGNITLDSIDENAKFRGQISGSGNSMVESKFNKIIASVDLSDNASLVASGLTLDSTHNTISLKNNASLSVDSITANALSTLSLSVADTAKANVKRFIFSGGNIANFGVDRLLGENIIFQQGASLVSSNSAGLSISNQNINLESGAKLETSNAINIDTNANIALDSRATLKTSELKLTNTNGATINAKSDAKIYVAKLTLDKSKFIFNELNSSADSTTSSISVNVWQNLNDINLQNASTAHFNHFTLQAQNLNSDSTSRFVVNRLDYTQTSASANDTNSIDPSASKNINANTSILDNLSLFGVGADSNAGENRYYALNFAQNLNLESSAKMQVSFDASVFKGDSSVETGKFYTLLRAGSLSDNRVDKHIDFTFADSNKAFYMVSKTENDSIQIKFLDDDPKSLNELNKHIAPSLSPIAQALLEHNSNDLVLDSAVKTDDYGLLSEYLGALDKNMQSLAQSDRQHIGSHILFVNNHSINARVAQVRFAQIERVKSLHHMYLASADKVRFKNQFSDVRSDFDVASIESSLFQGKYRPLVLNEAYNNAWISGSFARFSGVSDMKFYGTNMGYDRFLKAKNGDVLLGIMAGFGYLSASLQNLKDNSLIYSAGFYAHALFSRNEIMSNINISFAQSNKQFNTANALSSAQNDSGKQNNIAGLWSVYYKYNFNLPDFKHFYQQIKPVVAVGVGFYHLGEFIGNTYKMSNLGGVSVDVGAGVEYALGGENVFFSTQILLREGIYQSAKMANMRLTNATNNLQYEILGNVRSVELNISAAHKIIKNLYMQYGIMGLYDSAKNLGIKGDIKLGLTF